jgi:hypothetical protein
MIHNLSQPAFRLKSRTVVLTVIGWLLLSAAVFANNITITNVKLTGQNTTSGYTMVQFDISWENSWRTSAGSNNWDAAWVFVKYRVAGGAWQHAWLDNSGHTTPAGSLIDIGLLMPGTDYNATTNPGLGAFIFRSADGTGTFTSTGIQLRWNYGANGIADDAAVDIRVYAIEMVSVPQGAFALGSGGSETAAFYKYPTTTNTYQVSSEAGITVGTTPDNLYYPYASGTSGDQAGPIPPDFPKGYDAFYCMKYEISQQGYVDFLNSLTQTQANTRKYTYTGERYAITGSTVGSYATTNPYVACNWLSWADVAAWLDWSGLRPMTELEFEKACRGTAPPVANEYVWGTGGIAGSGYTLSNDGAFNEAIATNYDLTNGNALYNSTIGTIAGPLRSGIFAGTAGNAGRVTSGATYYGIMEMSGNVWERPVTAGNSAGRAFTGSHGDGILNVSGDADASTWPGTDASGAGLRGCSYNNSAANLQISDRYLAAFPHSNRYYAFGGRGVRTYLTGPTVSTTAVSAITMTSATCGGNVITEGNGAVTARGVCWSTTQNPTVAGAHTTDGNGTGVFASNLTGLTAGTLYFVRAYATNIVGTSYGVQESFTTLTLTCGNSFTIDHVAGAVAPVTKTVIYGTVTNIPGETTKCWITSNLGADQQATAVDDASEASAGWYWQFNRMQGYKNDGTTVTPSWTITSISENVDWQPANDPCRSELSGGWRIPTVTEWMNVNTGWTNWNGPWGSGLKLHAAGMLYHSNGDLLFRGTDGLYWSSEGSGTTQARHLGFSSTYSNGASTSVRAEGFSLRCIRPPAPTVTTSAINNITPVSATCGGNVTSDGGAPVTSRGVCWATTQNPTTANSISTDSSGTGSFTSTITGLIENATYFVRAYATNSSGTSYGNEVSFIAQISVPSLTTIAITSITNISAISGGTITSDGGSAVTARGVCWNTSSSPTTANSYTVDGDGTGVFISGINGLVSNITYYVRAYATNSIGTSYGNELIFTTLTTCGTITVNHVAGTVAPVTKTVTYNTVTNIPGETAKCWISSNLGASQQATAVNDATEPSAGWYWQFDRKQGYKNDGATLTPSWTTATINENFDWQAANDPCTIEIGAGWRVPTNNEWTNVDASGGWTNWNGPWNSALKMHAAGYLDMSTGALNYRGTYAWYWSSTSSNGSMGPYLNFSSGSSSASCCYNKLFGFPLRCIRDSQNPILPTVTTSALTNITLITATGGGNVTSDGGISITARGICWSTTTNPTLSNSYTTDGSGSGMFVSTLTGLTQNTQYFVRAYATNNIGTSYGNEVNFTTLPTCGSITINHVAGAVAPVSKTVTYNTVANMLGEPSKCWITSNLGSDHQATAKDDATEASAGWYWQFNRMQGYKHDGTNRTPGTAWSWNINENSNWSASNDPCVLLLGGDWRMPTSTEWTNVDASGNWWEWIAAWNSALKLHAGGYLGNANGNIYSRGVDGYFWSSYQYNNTNSYFLYINHDHNCLLYSGSKDYGENVRCIKDN